MIHINERGSLDRVLRQAGIPDNFRMPMMTSINFQAPGSKVHLRRARSIHGPRCDKVEWRQTARVDERNDGPRLRGENRKMNLQSEQSCETENREEIVSAYLRDNPDFFTHYPDLLRQLELPHSSGDAVSLIERQVKVVAGRDCRLQAKTGKTDCCRQGKRRAQQAPPPPHAYADRSCHFRRGN